MFVQIIFFYCFADTHILLNIGRGLGEEVQGQEKCAVGCQPELAFIELKKGALVKKSKAKRSLQLDVNNNILKQTKPDLSLKLLLTALN